MLILRGLFPATRESPGDIHRQQSAENGVAGKGRRRGKNRVVELLLDIEQRRKQFLELQPLIVPHAVYQEEDDRPFAELGEHETWHYFMREDRPFFCRTIRLCNPFFVLVLDETPERTVGLLILIRQDLPGTFIAFELEVKPDEALINFDPFVVREVGHQCARDLIERLQVPLRNFFVADPPPFEQALQRQEDLAWIDRLRQVVADLAAEGLLHQVLLLALGDHHHGHIGRELLDFGERLERSEERRVGKGGGARGETDTKHTDEQESGKH